MTANLDLGDVEEIKFLTHDVIKLYLGTDLIWEKPEVADDIIPVYPQGYNLAGTTYELTYDGDNVSMMKILVANNNLVSFTPVGTDFLNSSPAIGKNFTATYQGSDQWGGAIILNVNFAVDEIDIKYDWLLDDGNTYETRYDKISPNTELISFSDGPTIHTAAETPVSVATYYHNNGGRVEFEVDTDKNVTGVKLYNQSNTLKQYDSTGPFDQYSAYLDLNFASSAYLKPDGTGYVIDFQDGDIYQVRYTISNSGSIVKRWSFNTTQIQNVKIVSGGSEYSTSLQTISKTITSGTPDTAQVTAEIRIPSQFISSGEIDNLTSGSVVGGLGITLNMVFATYNI